MSEWYKMGTAEALEQLNSRPSEGLTTAEANRRLEQYGLNELIERGLKSPWRILWEQMTAVMVVILIIAAVISMVLGDY